MKSRGVFAGTQPHLTAADQSGDDRIRVLAIYMIFVYANASRTTFGYDLRREDSRVSSNALATDDWCNDTWSSGSNRFNLIARAAGRKAAEVVRGESYRDLLKCHSDKTRAVS